MLVNQRRIYIVAFYAPPYRCRDEGVYDLHVASLREICDKANDCTVLACGDYNQPHIAWDAQEGTIFLDPSLTSSATAALVDGINSLDFYQFNAVCNYRGRILDLVFAATESTVIVNEAVVPLLELDAHHPALMVSIPSMAIPADSMNDPVIVEASLNYAKIDFEELNIFLSQCDWNSVFVESDVNNMVAGFYNIVLHWLELNTPKHRAKVSPVWCTPLLRSLKRDKNACLRKLRKRRNPETKRDFQRTSYAYRRYNASLYKSYVLRIQSNIRRNPKCFWSFVNSKRKSSNIPGSVYLGDCTSTSPLHACNLFATHFASVFCESTTLICDAERAAANVPENLIDLRTFVVNPSDVLKAVNKLKCSTTPGPDGIPAIVLCQCATALSVPLSRIFTASLSQGVFPDAWKDSYMFPVHKKGDKHDVSNYRGITSLSAASKLFEIIVNDVIFFHVKSYIATTQHGFMPGRSVTTNLMEFTSTCIRHMEERIQVDTLYTDLKAAFDRIDHLILQRKLSRLGASDNFILWLQSYLSNRTLHVKIGSQISPPFKAKSGVPQGSNLGPLLFSIFYNDVTYFLRNDCILMYADDLKMFKPIRCVDDCHCLQEMLNNFVKWCNVNKITVSISKCAVMTFHRSRKPIFFDYSIGENILERVNEVSDLGVLLDSKLTFDLHRSTIISKANRQLGFISRISRDFTDPHCLKALYCSLVRPILETASIVWIPRQLFWNIRIERIQKRFIRRALRQLPWRQPLNLPPYVERCRLIQLDTLQRRRSLQQAIFVAKLLNGEVQAPNLLSRICFRTPGRLLRHSNLLHLDNHRSSFGQHEPFTSMIRTFSSVEEMFEFGKPTAQFRRMIENSNQI